ncbi:MAG: FkbM family methyltransferase [Thermoleophilaceae bacterium]|nr:FkbM family methyltransferase [Thermoleophilaceae bacterium]
MANSTANFSGKLRDQARKAKKLTILAGNKRWRAAVRHGVAATVEHRDVGWGKEFATVLDVGGHHGQFTLFALERFPRAKVITFEPQAEGVEKIRSAIAGDPRVTIQNYALSDSVGTAELHISKRSDSSSLLSIGEGQTTAYPGTEEATTEEIALQTLDNLVAEPLEGPVLLKIDVQGAELSVLRGAEKTLQSIDSIFVECSFVELYEGQALANEVIEFLAARGFRIAGVFGPAYDSDGRCLQVDALFSRQ